MSVIQVFPPPLFPPHIQIIKAPLPDAIGAMQVRPSADGQGEAYQLALGQTGPCPEPLGPAKE